MNKTLGQRIKELRYELDLSLRELAQRMNSGSVSATHLSDIEQGRRYPSDELLEKLARALGTSLEDLKQFDSRAPLEEIKRRTENDPNFGFALRKLVDKEVSSDDIINFVNKKSQKENK